MTTEATKTMNRYNCILTKYLQGRGIDIGCGNAPIRDDVDRFDRTEGDAEKIGDYVHKLYDFVFSSHTLEHMTDPFSALEGWFSLVKPNGYLVLTVPDEDLYEQGLFPSIFNGDHKHTFTISKTCSWSPVSVNVVDLVKKLNGSVEIMALQDDGYDRSLLRHSPPFRSLLFGHWLTIAMTKNPRLTPLLSGIARMFGLTIDQTMLADCRLAQILVVIKKN